MSYLRQMHRAALARTRAFPVNRRAVRFNQRRHSRARIAAALPCGFRYAEILTAGVDGKVVGPVDGAVASLESDAAVALTRGEGVGFGRWGCAGESRDDRGEDQGGLHCRC